MRAIVTMLLLAGCSGEPFSAAELADTEPDAASDAADASGGLDAPGAGGSGAAADAGAGGSGGSSGASGGAGGSTSADAACVTIYERKEICAAECPPGWDFKSMVYSAACGGAAIRCAREVCAE